MIEILGGTAFYDTETSAPGTTLWIKNSTGLGGIPPAGMGGVSKCKYIALNIM